MVQEQQLEGSGVGGLKLGGGYGLDRPHGGNNPTRGDVVALLEQVLPAGAPQPTEEDINFLLEQFRKLEPGTALSFDPALLGQRTGDGTSNSLGPGRLQLDVAFGPPPPLLLPPASFDDPQSCMGINDEALVFPPARGLQAAALSGPVGETRNELPRCGNGFSSCGDAAAGPRTKAASSLPHRAGREERMQRQRRMESAPPTKSDAFNHSGIRDALRRVKEQVKAVEQLRSSIALEQDKSESRKRRRRRRHQ
jgi:hypothetical protein